MRVRARNFRVGALPSSQSSRRRLTISFPSRFLVSILSVLTSNFCLDHKKNEQKLRVDQSAGAGQIHTYFGDWKTASSTFILSQNPLLCYSSPNPNAVPDPQFFRKAQFMGRVQINGVLTQHWCTNAHSEERGCVKERHRPGQIDLFVREGSTPAEPVRYVPTAHYLTRHSQFCSPSTATKSHFDTNIYVLFGFHPCSMNFWGWQLDFATFRPGFSGDPKVWEIPTGCGRSAVAVEDVFTLYAATLKR